MQKIRKGKGQKMSEDLIKRSDAIEAVADYFDYSRRFVEGILNEVPSADRPQGEWIKNIEWWCVYKCSVCGNTFDELTDYCPNRGARMFVKDINVPNKKGADDD